MKMKSYSELSKLPMDYKTRLDYLYLGDHNVGEATFGGRRWLNQEFYKHDSRYLKARDEAILRDEGTDMGIEGMDIPNLDRQSRLMVHHINPITADDILNQDPCLYDLDNLICVSATTHRRIHYGNNDILALDGQRSSGDTKLW